MRAAERFRLFDHFRKLDADYHEFEVQRGHLEEGKSFSSEAMDTLTQSISLFVGARILARWDRTKEPPSVVHVTVKVA